MQNKILITRDAKQNIDFKFKLENKGFLVYEFPVIEVKESANLDNLNEALANLIDYDWLILASVNAASIICAQCISLTGSLTILNNIKIATIGAKTRDFLLEKNIKVTFVPQNFVAENFVSGFPDYPNLNNLNILFPRASLGRDYITKKLTLAGSKVNEIHIYESNLPGNIEQKICLLQKFLLDEKIKIITLLSSQTVINFHYIYTMANLSLSNLIFACIGPQTRQTVLDNFPGFCVIQPETYTTDCLIDEIEKYINTTNQL